MTSPIREDVVDPHSFEDVAARSFNKAERVRVGGEGGGGEARQGQTETRSVVKVKERHVYTREESGGGVIKPSHSSRPSRNDDG